jgi:hypothetical protein
MATALDLANMEDFLPAIVVLMKNATDSLVETQNTILECNEESQALGGNHVTRVHAALVDMNTIVASVLHNFRLAHARTILDEELGYWVLS